MSKKEIQSKRDDSKYKFINYFNFHCNSWSS